MNKVDNNEEFIQWIMETVPLDELLPFFKEAAVLPLARQYFGGKWKDYCEEHPDEPEFPYETAVYSQPQIYFEDVDGNETGDWMDLLPGTLVEVIRKSDLFPGIRLCRIANGDPNQYFWLEIEEITYGNQ